MTRRHANALDRPRGVPGLARLIGFVAALVIAVAAEAAAEVTIFFGGDTSHGESYQDQYAAAGGENIVEKRGYAYFFDRLRPLMADADLTVLNLETPLTVLRDPPFEDKAYNHYSDPVLAARSLRDEGVDAVALANNHTLDFGPAALRETFAALDAVGVDGFGAGEDLGRAEAPFVKQFGGVDAIAVAVVSNFEVRDSYKSYGFYAADGVPGANPIDIDRLRDQIAELKGRTPAPLVIVSPHWGQNYVWRSEQQRALAEQILDAGADMIVGHGAHRVQEIERIDGRWVFYSVGNLVFNTKGRFKKLNSPPYSLPLRITLSRGDAGYRVAVRGYPIVSDNVVTGYTPRPVTPDEMEHFKREMLEHDTTGVLAESAEWRTDDRGSCVVVAGSIPPR